MEAQKYFKKKYPYIETMDLEFLEGRAKEILVHLLFKSHTTTTKEQKEYAYKEYPFWIMACMQEMLERMGCTSALSYKENGISITFDQSQLSQGLINEIVPIANVRG